MIGRAARILTAALIIPKAALSLTLTEGTVWTEFPIPVCFENPKREHEQDRQQIRKSVEQSWAKESAVSFKGWGACREDSRGIRIQLSDDHPKTLMRGRQLDGVKNGVHLPKLWGLASLSINAKSTVHEFGHALGFGHEYARADANYEDACAAKGKDGQRYLEDDLPITAFDFDSIMVACIKDATRNFSTGVPKLSAADIYGLIKTYGSAPENILDKDEPGDRFGHSLAVGDFNGDAFPDLAIGAPGETPAGSSDTKGAVYIYKGDDIRGLRPWTRLTGNGAPGFGTQLQTTHLDQNNRADLIVTAADGTITTFKGHSSKPPQPWPDAPPAPTVTATTNDTPLDIKPFDTEGTPESIEFGHITTLADLDADGHNDLIITAPKALINGAPSGQVFIYRSPNTNDPWKHPPPTFTPWYHLSQSH